MALCRVENYFIASFCGDQLFENNVKAVYGNGEAQH